MIPRLTLCAALAGAFLFTPADAVSQPEPPAAAAPAATDAVQPADAGAAADPLADSELKDVAGDVETLIDATRTGSWIGIVGAIIAILMNLLRLPALGSLTKKIPRRWRIVTVIALGGVAGILASIAAGVPWAEAIAIGLFSGPSAVFQHEFIKNGLMATADKRAAANGNGQGAS